MSDDVLIVIPCLRESGRIQAFLQALVLEMALLGQVHILVVDDGSGAEEVTRMQAIMASLQTEHPFLSPLLALPENIGKGGAIYAGWKQHAGERWLMFVDADGSISASEVSRLIQQTRAANSDSRAIFGSRVKMLGRVVERFLYRHLMGRVYATLVSEALDIPVYDSQCGCKLVPREAYERSSSSLTLQGFAFDVDLLLALQSHGCEVVEFPLDWREIPGGRVRIFRDSWRMICDVMHLRKIWPPERRRFVAN